MSYFFCYGPLPPGSSLFRGRQIELDRLVRLCRGEMDAYAIIYGGRQTGKTSLLVRLAASLPEHIRACRVDFQGMRGAKTVQAYTYLAQRLTSTLPNLGPAGEIPDAPSLTEFLCDAIELSRTHRLVLLLEELGALSEDARYDLAHTIRSIFSNRTDPSCKTLERLRVILAGSIELYELAATEVSPLKNVCDPFYLPDLREEEATGLVAEGLMGLGLVYELADPLGHAIYNHVEGHPYLTQRLGAALESHLAKGQTPTAAHVDSAAEWVLVCDDPLLHHLNRALDDPYLATASESLLKRNVQFSRMDPSMARLELLGLAKGVGGLWTVRNQLFEQALHNWIDSPRNPQHRRPKGEGPPRARRLRPALSQSTDGPTTSIRKRWAILVGVNHFVDPAFSDLQFCVNDVTVMEEMLQGYDYTTVALHDDVTEEHRVPTRLNVEDELARVCTAAAPDDLLWVHFSCHGILVNEDPMLITREIRRLTLAEKALPLSEVERRMRESEARRLVLTLDACHTGVEIDRDLGDSEFIRNAHQLAEGFVLLAGSTAQQVAQEWKAKEHGVFTYFLLDGLSGQADRTCRGFVTVDDLKLHVLDGLRQWIVENGGLIQDPTARTEGLGDMILAELP